MTWSLFDQIVSEVLDVGFYVAIAVVIFLAVLTVLHKREVWRPTIPKREPAGACWRVLPPYERGSLYDWADDE